MPQPTSFAIIPEQQDISLMERDLRFHPCTNQDPRALTSEQIEQFNRDGFLKGIAIFDTGQAEANRGYFDSLLTRVLAAGGDSYSISTAHLKYGKVYDLLTHPHHRCHRQGPAGRECHRLGFAFLLQDAA